MDRLTRTYIYNENINVVQWKSNALHNSYNLRGVPRIWEGGGGQEIFFEIWKFACRKATC